MQIGFIETSCDIFVYVYTEDFRVDTILLYHAILKSLFSKHIFAFSQ